MITLTLLHHLCQMLTTNIFCDNMEVDLVQPKEESLDIINGDIEKDPLAIEETNLVRSENLTVENEAPIAGVLNNRTTCTVPSMMSNIWSYFLADKAWRNVCPETIVNWFKICRFSSGKNQGEFVHPFSISEEFVKTLTLVWTKLHLICS
ncbi:uncharacterized protein LOC142328911 [Lycorma delicatula]|uniref:uncharacterized protein LOC142328911 n=1 Tax=Lycorma delicatula TaxID=130591 RepID=UPI003F50E778